MPSSLAAAIWAALHSTHVQSCQRAAGMTHVLCCLQSRTAPISLARRSSGGINKQAKDLLLASSPPLHKVAASLQSSYMHPSQLSDANAAAC